MVEGTGYVGPAPFFEHLKTSILKTSIKGIDSLTVRSMTVGQNIYAVKDLQLWEEAAALE